MGDKFIIKGRKPLAGEVEISGYKNAAGPCLAATLLTDEDVILDNLPLVKDVLSMVELLREMGADINWEEEKRIKINTANLDPQKIDPQKVAKSRISVLLIGSLLHKTDKFRFFRPGGDRIGLRPLTTHLEALQQLEVKISQEGDFLYIRKENELEGKEVVLREFSVTATENVILASVLAKGKTIIKIAAADPQVQDLCKMLISMGAKIRGIGTHVLEIEGVKKLKGVSHKICPDPLEAGTFTIVGAVTKGKIKIKNIIFDHLTLFLKKLREIGVDFQREENNSLLVNFSPNLKATKIQALPFPGFPTDLLPVVVPLLTQA